MLRRPRPEGSRALIRPIRVPSVQLQGSGRRFSSPRSSSACAAHASPNTVGNVQRCSKAVVAWCQVQRGNGQDSSGMRLAGLVAFMRSTHLAVEGRCRAP